MTRPRIIALCALAICAAGLLGLLWPHQREPRYEGRSLTEWLRLYRPFGSVESSPSQEAADAVRHIGTNALPLLVSWIQEAKDVPPGRQRLCELVDRWGFGPPTREILLESLAGPDLRAQRATWGFRILGEAGRGATPNLARVASEGKRPSSDAAIEALSHLGQDALPSLLSMISNTAFPPRSDIRR